MTDPPKKLPWFQYHLSTAIVMMFVASGLLWLNMQRNHHSYGWPLPFIAVWHVDYFSPSGPWESYEMRYDPIPWGIALNVVIWLAIMLGVGVFCEWLIRRRERQP